LSNPAPIQYAHLERKGDTAGLWPRRLSDLAAVLVFAAIAAAFYHARTAGSTPFTDLTSDAGNIASFAAAYDHPELFEGDGLLDDPDNFRFYATIHIPLTRALARATGNYGDAFICMLPLEVFLHALGFYLLGIAVFRRRLWAFVFALMMLPQIRMGLGTAWGLFLDPLPRLSLTAALGFLLAAAISWRDRPRRWPWIMLGAGALMYVHPVAAPVVGFALWLGFWVSVPPSWSVKKRLLYMLLIGLLFVAVSAPFAVIYLKNHAHGVVENYAQIIEIMQYRLTEGFLDIPHAVGEAFWKLTTSLVLPLGLIGTAVTCWVTGASRDKLRVIGCWLTGILFVSVVIPLVEQAVARAAGAIPVEIDLVRGIRFVVLIMLLLFVWGLAELSRRFRRPLWVRPVLVILSLVWVGYFAYQPPPGAWRNWSAPRQRRRWPGIIPRLEKHMPQRSVRAAHHQAVMAIRDTPVRSRILPIGVNPLAVRYAALRPVVFAEKDGGVLVISNHQKLPRWYRRSKTYRTLTEPWNSPWKQDKAAKMVEWARGLGADYLAVTRAKSPDLAFPPGTEVIWSNQSYGLVRISSRRGRNEGIPSTRAPRKMDAKVALAGPILDAKLPLREVSSFILSRLPPMPKVKNVEEWAREARRMRQEILQKVIFRGEARKWRDAKCRVEWLENMAGGPGYHIKKVRFEILPGMWIPALLYQPENLQGKVPVSLHVNGHERKGKAARYKQLRSINLAKRGMLVLDVEWFGWGQMNHKNYQHSRMNQLDLCGTSGLAPFYLSLTRSLDLLLSLEHADASRVAVSGLSGGGWQTIMIGALDPRVTLANPVAGYTSCAVRTWMPSDLGDSEQAPADLATVADYTHLTAMRAPRPTLLTYNRKDRWFNSSYALQPLLDAAGPIFKLYGKEHNLRSYINLEPGDHNFGQDNRKRFYRRIGDHFYPGNADFIRGEIHSKNDVKTFDQLKVPLPANNENFHSLALAISKGLPRQADLPRDKTPAEAYQQERVKELRSLVRSGPYRIKAQRVREIRYADGTAVFWRLEMGGWTVPAVELSRGPAKETVILLADAGRKNAAKIVETLLQNGSRILAIDPFCFGESRISKHDFLWALMVSAVGERPLGIQAGQVAATARWMSDRVSQPIKVLAIGRRSSLFCLVAAALEPEAIRKLELHHSLGSLREVIELNLTVQDAPELFCFGLLGRFDIRQITALVAPRPVLFINPSKRVKTELAGLKAWYALFGSSFDPCQ